MCSNETRQYRHTNPSTYSYSLPCHKPLFPSRNRSELIFLAREPSWVLFLDIGLRTTLLCLASVVCLLSSKLGIAVTGDTSYSALDYTSNAIGNTTSEIIDLALGLFSLALGVLLLTLLFQ